MGKRENTTRPAAKRRLTGRQKILLAAAIVLAAAVAAAAAYKSLFVQPELPGEEEPDAPVQEIDWGDGIQPKAGGARKSDAYYTVLILGRDTGGGGNTDTMLLASYDVTNQKATVMSIPRDTMVNVSWDVKKINSVYNTYGCGDKGIQALYKEISQLVGFAPDYQVVVEWEAVGKIVDAIGGVWFDVPYTMDYHDPEQDLVIEQEKGYRLLSGDDAMQVIRWRKNDKNSPYGYHTGIGDYGRMEVQQNFLKAVMEQMMQPANVLHLGELAGVFQESVQTDLSFQNILWFGKQAFSGGLSMENVTFLTMPWKSAEAYSRSYHRYLEYVVPIPNQLLEIVNTQLSPFQETFTLSDLDIMSVNADGSLRSSTGHLEDSRAAAPVTAPSSPAVSSDAEAPDSTTPDADASDTNASDPQTPAPNIPDAGTSDTEAPDPGVPDTGTPDAEAPDAGIPNTGTPDAETPDAGTPSAEAPDSTAPGTEAPDTNPPDAAIPDVSTPGPDTPPADEGFILTQSTP